MKCWYCGEKERIDDEALFCKDCKDIKNKKSTSTLVIYDKI